MKAINLLLLVLACMAGCSKSNKGDAEKPTITVSTPAANQQFSSGAVVNIKATVNDNTGLHSIHLIVINKNSSAEVIHFTDHLDAGSYDLNKSFIVVAGTTYLIYIEAEDHSGNVAQMNLEIRGI